MTGQHHCCLEVFEGTGQVTQQNMYDQRDPKGNGFVALL
jgi:hypothetical protein